MVQTHTKEFGIKRILIISYRQTLTNELYGNYNPIGFESYMDGNLESDKLICQIQSLYKLVPENDFLGVPIEIPSYDLVIIDEIESVLAHYKSTTLKNPRFTFDLMCSIIHNSKKLLVLDGDFHNRSYDFIKSFGESRILKNEYKKVERTLFLLIRETILKARLMKTLKMVRTLLLLVCLLKLLHILLINIKNFNYKTVLHCAKSDDADKEKLKNVNKHWVEYRVVVYSPSIEAGVNFDVKHFNKIYVVLSVR